MDSDFRIGYGYDVHRLVEGRDLVLGGVTVPHKRGLDGHSDADVLLHAISDALLGTLALGDIGKHFPDTDEAFKNADSRRLLKKVYRLIEQRSYHLVNIDSVIVAQKPKLASYIDEMRQNIASDLALDLDRVSVKATTSEMLGFEGEEKGISARAAVLISKGS
ncbi:2-C-methyl-D-erythritol 2,4-cyclodiphosphate synthase [Balneolaceae bacterium YR4-1]|uniref:2-C-methyl-D-erythritol 2,4-cyclodiphosphate synthase n=1 Tax=Halalkalibaculum roseum TaxID=2709311 RepID=A0A6M1T0C3_9BACT|nr:2-C-methyl-D-erythritol 2,4-cyclodiphosphate synthase [Halalkalibaculum roseum]NGP78138.1 2-C-methyl-D-erythritol 2,4-cyclodiphosphate synthase [Halalkalibaculum roseum]